MSILKTLSRVLLTARLLLVQSLQRTIITLKNSWLFSPSTQPNAWQHIITNQRSLYASRIFTPSNVRPDAKPRPLIIITHGGGFIMNNPSVDDALARRLSDRTRSVVISIDYRKAPLHRFPAAYDDVVDTTLAILARERWGGLAVDRSNVSLIGSSAGANLVLAAAQNERLRGRIAGVVALYAPVNFAVDAATQMATRPVPTVPDMFEHALDMVVDLYVGTRDAKVLRDPRLSPTFFASRADLPERLFLIGAEHDLMCGESRVMAEKLAAGAEREELEDGWRAGGVRWKMAGEQAHGFDVFPLKEKAAEERRLREKESLYTEIAGWLTEPGRGS